MSSPSLVLSGRHDLSTLSALRDDLLREVEAGSGPVRLDCGAVEAADVGFLQLLLSFQKSLRGAGRDLSISPSPAVGELFARLGAPLPGAPA